MLKNSKSLTTTEAARFLNLHPNTIIRKAKSGLIPYESSTGGWYIFRKADLEAYLKFYKTKDHATNS